MKRVTPKTTKERQNKKPVGDFPKLKEILVNLSVREVPKVTRKLRLVGGAMEIAEIQPRVAVWSVDQKTNKKKRDWVKKDFPDAAVNSSPTRIGHDDETQCPWREWGYQVNRRFVQRCLEEQEDGTWAHKILVKGPSIFDHFTTWEEGRREEAADDDTITTFLGGRSAPSVKIVAVYDASKLGDVDYKVFFGPKDMPLTEQQINLLREVHEPTADELNAYRAEYNEARSEDPDMPEWEDYYEFGHDIRKIFKYTPPRTQSDDAPADAERADDSEDSTEDDTESTVTTPEVGEDDIDLGDW